MAVSLERNGSKNNILLVNNISDLIAPYCRPLADGLLSDRGTWEEQRESFVAQSIEAAMSQSTYRIGLAEANCESPIEKIAYLHLLIFVDRSACECGGGSFETQVPIGNYRADFVAVSQGLRVVIECDGHEFHVVDKVQARADRKRDRVMQSMGYRVLRYTGSELVGGKVSISDDLIQLFNEERRSYWNGISVEQMFNELKNLGISCRVLNGRFRIIEPNECCAGLWMATKDRNEELVEFYERHNR